MRVSWPDEVDRVLGGDLTAALAYVTPAGGTVVAGVSPCGLRDRDAGTVTFTTSFGFGKKLERIERDPHVALAYHAREHGLADGPLFVLVQGTRPCRPRARRGVEREGARPRHRPVHGRAAPGRAVGPPAAGVLRRPGADHRRRRADRRVAVARLLGRARGARLATARRPAAPVAAQEREPARGWTPRKPRASWPSAPTSSPRGARPTATRPWWRPAHRRREPRAGSGIERAPSLPPGGRRAGVLAHAYEKKLTGAEGPPAHAVGSTRRRCTRPTPQTGFAAPKNKTLTAAGQRPAGQARPAQGPQGGPGTRGAGELGGLAGLVNRSTTLLPRAPASSSQRSQGSSTASRSLR